MIRKRQREKREPRRAAARWRAALLVGLAFVLLMSGAAPATTAQIQGVDEDEKGNGRIAMREPPLITGAYAVWKESPLGKNAFTVTLDFGELSPINPSPVVRMSLALTINVNRNYQIAIEVANTGSADPNAVQLSDVGVGARNLRLLGGNGCPGDILTPFENDPALSMSLNPATGRATYPVSLASVTSRTTIIRGPRLPSAGATFDLIFAIAPSFYSPGNVNLIVTVWLLSGPNFNC